MGDLYNDVMRDGRPKGFTSEVSSSTEERDICDDLMDLAFGPKKTRPSQIDEVEINIPKKSDRFNAGKTPWQYFPWEWALWLLEVLEGGSLKYEWNNWQLSLNTPDHESFKTDRIESAFRHMYAYFQGEVEDAADHEELVKKGWKKGPQHHLVKAALNLLMAAWYDKHHKGFLR